MLRGRSPCSDGWLRISWGSWAPQVGMRSCTCLRMNRLHNTHCVLCCVLQHLPSPFYASGLA
jgi:hypothetical protein